jgi:hypothetical protein
MEKMSAFQSETIQSTAEAILRCRAVWSTHPKQKGMTYTGHFYHALSMARRMAIGSIYLAIHSVFPFWFESAGSDVVKELYDELSSREMKDM